MSISVLDNPDFDGDPLLGPIIDYFLHNLDAHIRYLDDDRTAFLFLTRGGVRIASCYEQYLDVSARRWPVAGRIMLSSRLLVCKGIAPENPEVAFTTIAKEFSGNSVRDAVSALLGTQISNSDELLLKPCTPTALLELYQGDNPYGDELRGYLSTQSTRLKSYLKHLIGTASRIVLIDTGWEGTTQRLLARAFPDLELVGLYFGWMGESWESEKDGIARGLIFNASRYAVEKPETAITLHRHLIESLFEPRFPSVEELPDDDLTFSKSEAIVREMRREKLDEAQDAHFFKVLSYLQKNAARDLGVKMKVYQAAIRQLSDRLTYPCREDALTLAGPSRSADFGRQIQVPVLLHDALKKDYSSVKERIEKSLWPLGQIALEFDEQSRLVRQEAWLKKRVSLGPFRAVSVQDASATVAIITRTKDRPLLLQRASRSVGNQTYQNFTWVVVNDGGDQDEVRAILDKSSVPPHQIVFCNNMLSVGMEAASNIGIRSCRSDLVVIHDDDDSWHPDFLSKAVGFLSDPSRQRYGGVVTGSYYISEKIEGPHVTELGRWPYHDWVEHIQLSELIVENFFPPIAFLFRRSIAEAIGLFDEELPVLGDWDFAIRFLMRADIGVLRDPLAYYHHRIADQTSNYSNSVVGGVAKHIEFNSVVRNKFIRGAGTRADWQVLGSIMAQAYSVRDIRARLKSTAKTLVTPDARERHHPLEGRLSEAQQRLSEAHHRLSEAQRISDERWVNDQLNRAFFRGFVGFWRKLSGSSLSESQLRAFLAKQPLAPPADFDEAAYLKNYPDVAQAVAAGKLASGFEHYIKYGRIEGRNRP